MNFDIPSCPVPSPIFIAGFLAEEGKTKRERRALVKSITYAHLRKGLPDYCAHPWVQDAIEGKSTTKENLS